MSAEPTPTAKGALILRPDELPARNRGGGARTVPLVTWARGATGFLNGTTSFEPGAAIGHHLHNVAESVLVVSGQAIVDIDGVRTPLRAGDTTFVPGGIPHHFENTSTTEPMRIFWTYGSTDATRTMVETGAHGRIDAEDDGSAPQDTGAVVVVTLDALPGHETDLEESIRRGAALLRGDGGARSVLLEREAGRRSAYRLTVRSALPADRSVPDAWYALLADHLVSPPRVTELEHVLIVG